MSIKHSEVETDQTPNRPNKHLYNVFKKLQMNNIFSHSHGNIVTCLSPQFLNMYTNRNKTVVTRLVVSCLHVYSPTAGFQSNNSLRKSSFPLTIHVSGDATKPCKNRIGVAFFCCGVIRNIEMMYPSSVVMLCSSPVWLKNSKIPSWEKSETFVTDCRNWVHVYYEYVESQICGVCFSSYEDEISLVLIWAEKHFLILINSVWTLIALSISAAFKRMDTYNNKYSVPNFVLTS